MLQWTFGPLGAVDRAAVTYFLPGWIAYGYWADRGPGAACSLRGATVGHRTQWGAQMVRRDNRILDSALFAALTTLILLILWRRDCRSPALHALSR